MINCRLRLKTIIGRELNRSSALNAIKIKEQAIANEEFEPRDHLREQLQPLVQPQEIYHKSRYNSKYYIPNIEPKEDIRSLDESNNCNHLIKFESGLRPYLYSCVNANLDADALRTLEYYERSNSSISMLGPKSGLKLINILVKHYAINHNLNGIEQCIAFMEKLDLKPNLVFYSYFLYALAKNKHRSQIDTLMNSIQNQRLNVGELFANSYLNSEQRRLLIQTLKQCGFNFDFNLNKELAYDTKLLKNYQNSKSRPFSPLSGVEFDEKLFYQQLNNEKDIFVKMDSAYRVPTNQLYDTQIQSLISDWTNTFKKAFEANLNLMKLQTKDDAFRINLYPFLNSLNKDKLAKFLVSYLFELTKSKYPANWSYLAGQIGYLLENQYLSMIKLRNSKNLKAIYKNYFDYISDENKFAEANSRQICNKLFNDLDLFNREVNEMAWSSKIRRDVGSNVIELCIDKLRFNANLLRPKSKPKQFPAFFKTIQFENKKRNDAVSSNSLLNKITSTMSNQTFISAPDLPMLVPPFPWNSAEGFPFLISKLFLVIEPSVIYERLIAERLRSFNINAVLDSINYTSLTSWKVNSDVLAIQTEIFQKGGDYKLDIPHHHTKMPEIPKKAPDEPINAFKKRLFETKKQNREMYALWCEMNYKLSIANYVSKLSNFSIIN